MEDNKTSDCDMLVWVDLEMTGLNIDTDHIIEMACIITDKNLNVLAIGPEIVIHQSESVMKDMDVWCTEQHGKSGLTKQVIESDISLQQAESIMLAFVEKNTRKGHCPLAGNSVHADKKFLDKHMPSFINHLHYRIVDVSSIKELCRRWYPCEYARSPSKKGNHRALDDIQESINELKFYKEEIFK